MSIIDKSLVYTIIITSAAIAILLLISIEPPRSLAVRNQGKVALLLRRAHFDSVGAVHSQIMLGNGLVIMPERATAVCGYILIAHLHSSAFSIEARPISPGKTGLFTYFRDDAGVLRVEVGEEKAGPKSRPLGPYLPSLNGPPSPTGPAPSRSQ